MLHLPTQRIYQICCWYSTPMNHCCCPPHCSDRIHPPPSNSLYMLAQSPTRTWHCGSRRSSERCRRSRTHKPQRSQTLKVCGRSAPKQSSQDLTFYTSIVAPRSLAQNYTVGMQRCHHQTYCYMSQCPSRDHMAPSRPMFCFLSRM